MTSAVIIVLREVLEAMLLVCMLMASSSAMGLGLRWLVPALVAGLSGALAYALSLEQLSMAFDGFGQEIVNSLLLITTTALLIAFSFFAVCHVMTGNAREHTRLILVILIATATVGIMREGFEIYLYVYSYGLVADDVTSVMSGGAIGAGIGLSLGTFIYYGLKTFSPRHCVMAGCGLAVIIGSGMASLAALFLSQADILPATEPLWDSSSLIEESSLLGELLQAAIGYEASPTFAQMSIFLGAMLIYAIVMTQAWFVSRVKRSRM